MPGLRLFGRCAILLVLTVLAAAVCHADSILDRNGNVLLDGKPFFPVGVYLPPSEMLTVEKAEALRDIGLNCIAFEREPSDETAEMAKATGLTRLILPRELAVKLVTDLKQIETLPANRKPGPKLFLLSVRDDMLEYAAVRAVIDGAKGILYSLDRLPKPDALRKANEELKLMSKVALAPFPVEHVFPEDRLQVMYKELDGRRYVIAVNTTDQPQSLFIYTPDPTQPQKSLIGSDVLIKQSGPYFMCGFEKYGVKMFSWPIVQEHPQL